jgi:predicted alpha/beta superfamily hydrolase
LITLCLKILLITYASKTLAQTPLTKPNGQFVAHSKFHSKYLKMDRDIRVWLPPGYDRETRRRYPVFYLHDGQNLYKGGPSFIPGQAWNADTTALDLISSHQIYPVILVGIDNAGRDRINEYTPTEITKYPGSGRGLDYGKMLVEELKPFIDSHYRTLKDAKNTGLGGSSLGGLISLYLGLTYPKTFGKLAVMSPSVWWDENYICRMVKGLSKRGHLKIWLDIGNKEGDEAVSGARSLHATLIQAGWKDGVDLRYVEGEAAAHNERAWSDRFPDVLRFLFSDGLRAATSPPINSVRLDHSSVHYPPHG